MMMTSHSDITPSSVRDTPTPQYMYIHIQGVEGYQTCGPRA